MHVQTKNSRSEIDSLKPVATPRPSFAYRGKKFFRVRVPGTISAPSILAACKKQGLKPVCNIRSWNDGKCWTNGQQKYWSYPPHARSMGLPQSKLTNIYFYTGKVHVGAMLNYANSHRWARRGRDRGLTMCTGAPKPMKTKGNKSAMINSVCNSARVMVRVHLFIPLVLGS